MKLQNMVKFPLTGLDMTPHVVKRSQSSWSLPSHWSPWRRPYGLGRDPEDYIYDLYAVCNHHGTMQGGHYTAYCKNSVDGLWYCFDDSDVQQLSEDEVCTQTAYILFYQRRTAIPSWSANSSVADAVNPLLTRGGHDEGVWSICRSDDDRSGSCVHLGYKGYDMILHGTQMINMAKIVKLALK